MKYIIITSGSRGVVQPYCVIGAELIRRGHEVLFCVEKRLEDFVVSEFGLPYFCMPGDPTGLLYEKDAQVMLRDNQIMKLMKRVGEAKKEWEAAYLVEIEKAVAGADALICHPLVFSPAL